MFVLSHVIGHIAAGLLDTPTEISYGRSTGAALKFVWQYAYNSKLSFMVHLTDCQNKGFYEVVCWFGNELVKNSFLDNGYFNLGESLDAQRLAGYLVESQEKVKKMIENKAKLLPCPFCGSEPSEHLAQKGDRFCVTCAHCEGDGPLVSTMEKAFKYWNERK